MKGIILRFLIGGAFVSAFSFPGDIFRPKSFAGLFGAAPSIALSTLALTISISGKPYAATEARSMMAGAIAFFIYASCTSRVLMGQKFSALKITSLFIAIWFISAFGLWFVWLR